MLCGSSLGSGMAASSTRVGMISSTAESFRSAISISMRTKSFSDRSALCLVSSAQSLPITAMNAPHVAGCDRIVSSQLPPCSGRLSSSRKTFSLPKCSESLSWSLGAHPGVVVAPVNEDLERRRTSCCRIRACAKFFAATHFLGADRFGFDRGSLRQATACRYYPAWPPTG